MFWLNCFDCSAQFISGWVTSQGARIAVGSSESTKHAGADMFSISGFYNSFCAQVVS